MKKRFLPLFGLLLFLWSCSTDTTVQVARHPLIQFTSNATVWKSNTYSFVGPFQVVAYPANASQSGMLYNRFTLQASGKDDKGNNLQLNITFDAADASQLVGLYHPAYTTDRGLQQVQLYSLDNNNLFAYTLCANDTTAILQVQRQDPTQKLISGNFQMRLCNARDSSQKITITNGTFTDITY